MEKLYMNDLVTCFQEAIKQKAEYLAVVIETRGSKDTEVIINPFVNFEAKLEYYRKAYNDDLVLKTFDGIRIIDFTYADCYEDIENSLL